MSWHAAHRGRAESRQLESEAGTCGADRRAVEDASTVLEEDECQGVGSSNGWLSNAHRAIDCELDDVHRLSASAHKLASLE